MGQFAVLGLLALAALALAHKELKVTLFDPQFAAVQGWPLGGLATLGTVLTILAIMTGLQTVGAVLMAAMLIAPAVAARQWAGSFGSMLALAGGFGALSGGLGSQGRRVMTLVAALHYDLVILVTPVLTAWTCGLLGLFLVLRRQALLSDGIGHAALPGIVAAYALTGSLASLPALLGAALFGLLTVSATEALTATGRLRADAALGLVFPALFALGVLAISLNFSGVHLDLDAVLYGEITYAPFRVGALGLPAPWWTMGTLLGLALLLLGLLGKELKLSTFDPGLSRSLGFSPRLISALLLTLVALSVVAAFDVVGAILVVAFMITPPATALLLTWHLPTAQWLTAALGLSASLLGYAAALALDASIAGLIATVLGIQFLLAFAWNAWRQGKRTGVQMPAS
ncbi:hypothetical protein EJ104_09240 [Deinococcus radiophilus]|uniref:Metal ABC transporter permease n=1 Tax=Deinococcus radiophilus TaxID=32062 RepID=A0A3S0RDZ0_9DEIO|nr:hypothetical protein EJ104_09240 [Deinococcus radiophilus]